MLGLSMHELITHHFHSWGGVGQCKPQPWATLLTLKEQLVVFSAASEGIWQ